MIGDRHDLLLPSADRGGLGDERSEGTSHARNKEGDREAIRNGNPVAC
jgi:hypothetical protein